MAYQMKYRSEEEMRDSKVEWLGKIPKDWIKTDLIKALESKIADGPHETPEYVDQGIPFISVDSINDSETVNLDIVRKFISYKQYKEYNKKTRLQKNDILFTKSATIGKVAIVDDRTFMTWSPLAIIKANNEVINYKILYNILKSSRYIDYIKSISSLNTQLNVGMGVLEKSIITYSQDLEEQKKIANFLDLKTAEFDSIISKKELLIKKLEEAKRSLISEVVTGKVKIVDGELVERKASEMKDSGIEWLGMIPIEWEVKKLKYLVELRSEKQKVGMDSKYIGLENIESETGRYLDSEEDSSTIEGVGNVFKSKDVLFGKLRPYLTKCIVANFDGVSSSEILVFDSKKIQYTLLKYNLLNKKFIDLVNSSTYGVKMPRANWEFIGNIFLPYMDEKAQKELVHILERTNSKINLINFKIKQQIEKLSQAKQSLISEAVTGKIDLRDWEIQEI